MIWVFQTTLGVYFTTLGVFFTTLGVFFTPVDSFYVTAEISRFGNKMGKTVPSFAVK